MTRQWRMAAFVCFALVLAGFAAPAAAQAYRFTRIADTRSGFDPEWTFSNPSINRRGEVAFSGKRGDIVGVFRARRGRLTTIAGLNVRGVEFSDGASFFGNQSLNDRGQVAFAASLEGNNHVVYRGRGDGLTVIADTAIGPFDSFVGTVSLNNRGEVAFGADLDSGDDGVFIGRGGPVSYVYLSESSLFDGEAAPAINDRGQVAFGVFTDEGDEGMFLRTGSRTLPSYNWFRTLATLDGPIAGLDGVDASITEWGDVAFRAITDDGGVAIFKTRAGKLVRIADTQGEFYNLSDPSLNSRGEVAYVGFTERGEVFRDSLYVSTGSGSAVRVLQTGQTLGGFTVDEIFFDREGLNDRGQLAFEATFTNGHRAIYVATPRRGARRFRRR